MPIVPSTPSRFGRFAYRIVLLAFPARIRRRHGADMMMLFDEERRLVRGRPLAAGVLWLRAIGDALRHGLAMRAGRPAPVESVSVRTTRVATPRPRLRLLAGHHLAGAWRAVRSRPGFSVSVVLTLAVGIGATTAMTAIVNAVLVRALPFPRSDRLYMVRFGTGTSRRMDDSFPLSDADLLAWLTANHACSAVAAYGWPSFNLTGDGPPEAVQGALVTNDFFTVAGVRPARGRAFVAADDRAVVLSDEFWTRRYQRDPRIIGRAITLNNLPTTVVGVMPAGFSLPRPGVDLWRSWRLETPSRRGPYYLTGLARLRPDADPRALTADLASAAAVVKRRYGGDANWQFIVGSLKTLVVEPVRVPLLVLLAAVGCLLLIAVANAANLLLVRAVGRSRELAIRTALGAGRARIIGQLVTESVLLAAAAGSAGVALAYGLLDIVGATATGILPRLAEVRLDAATLAVTAGVSLTAGILFGLAPALAASRPDLHDALKQAGRPGTAARRSRFQRVGVAGQVALALVLAITAGLLLRSFSALMRTDLGVRPDHVLTFRFDLPMGPYDDEARRRTFFSDLIAKLDAIPGVVSSGYGTSLPPDQDTVTDNYTVEGFEPPAGQPAPIGLIEVSSPGLFPTLGIALKAGRFFDTSDVAGSTPVVVISESLARRYFPGGDAVGHRLKQGEPSRRTPWMTIVGVAGDVKYDGLGASPAPAYYVPVAQDVWSGGFIAVRTTVDPGTILPDVRRAVAAIDPSLPIRDVLTMEARVSAAAAPQAFHAALAAGLGCAGCLLAAFGIFAVVSYSVAQRRQEFGVRLALGASRAQVLRLVLREGIVLAIAGTAVGVAAALAVTRFIGSMLFGVGAQDPLTFAGLTVALLGITLAASLGPAWRATRVDPATAMRPD
jgi:putative ABC transport system permease protein